MRHGLRGWGIAEGLHFGRSTSHGHGSRHGDGVDVYVDSKTSEVYGGTGMI